MTHPGWCSGTTQSCRKRHCYELIRSTMSSCPHGRRARSAMEGLCSSTSSVSPFHAATFFFFTYFLKYLMHALLRRPYVLAGADPTFLSLQFLRSTEHFLLEPRVAECAQTRCPNRLNKKEAKKERVAIAQQIVNND